MTIAAASHQRERLALAYRLLRTCCEPEPGCPRLRVYPRLPASAGGPDDGQACIAAAEVFAELDRSSACQKYPLSQPTTSTTP